MATLDNAASDIVAYQRDSTVQRKELAQKTKEFRKSDDASKLTEIKGLLKGRVLDMTDPGRAAVLTDTNRGPSLPELH